MSEPLALLLSGALMASTLLLVLATGRVVIMRRTITRRTERLIGKTATDTRYRGPLQRLTGRLEAVYQAHRIEVLLGVIAVGLTLLGALAQQWVAGFLLGALAIAAFVWGQHQLRRRRQLLLEAQLVPALRMLAAATESGYSVRMALERMVEDLPSPIAEEFTQVMRAVDLGVSLEDALSGLAMRIGGESFEFFATMIAVQHRVGGSLSALLLDLAASLQVQQEFRLNVQAMTAQARFSGWVVTFLPLFVLGVILLLTPHYVAPLIELPEGRVLLGIAVALLVAGQFTIQRISKVEI